jgi:hypothetical protein
MKTLAAITAAALLVGCGTKAVTELEAVAQTSSYEQGFDDGCKTGLYERNIEFYGRPLAVDRFTRDDARFKTDKEYALAWDEGRRSCIAGRPGPSRR